MRKLLCAMAAVAATLVTFGAGSAQAESAPGCAGTVQIGSTAYGTYQGQTSISVKQFKGCGLNWAYIYVWQSFRDRHIPYTAHIEVAMQLDDANLPEGSVYKSGSPVELWSKGTDTLPVCTQAWGDLSFGANDGVTAVTTMRC